MPKFKGLFFSEFIFFKPDLLKAGKLENKTVLLFTRNGMGKGCRISNSP